MTDQRENAVARIGAAKVGETLRKLADLADKDRMQLACVIFIWPDGTAGHSFIAAHEDCAKEVVTAIGALTVAAHALGAKVVAGNPGTEKIE